ncbi:hypothetical protein [uncultured Winogradskyella sp.]|uniref:hypothetical protein n=1 Tax=uncultured Winogradskyella sp. TaxID=395353 RepID=UPI00260F8518|nr:hypothetical protein [uncultured Winogradskyella sp.]
MNVLNEIEKQIESIKKIDNSQYLDSILVHIRRAEFYYNQGKNDDYFFNDVIYRSNQAYEGALKESYKVLADKNQEEVSRKTPNDIEKYFESNDVFRERVLQLFKNYRQEWRNKSTHDYKLFFDNNEAFIALMSVTSFVHLLLNQIQEKLAYNEQQKTIEIHKEIIEKTKKIIESKTKKSTTKLIELINDFSKLNGESIFEKGNDIKEFEIIGLFHAFITSIDKNIEIQREPKISIGRQSIRPDFIIKVDNDPIIVEFKRLKARGSIEKNIFNQVLIYMQATNITKGIIYFARFNSSEPNLEVKEELIELNNIQYQITMIST